jgi:hypothetical protein
MSRSVSDALVGAQHIGRDDTVDGAGVDQLLNVVQAVVPAGRDRMRESCPLPRAQTWRCTLRAIVVLGDRSVTSRPGVRADAARSCSTFETV